MRREEKIYLIFRQMTTIDLSMTLSKTGIEKLIK